MSKVILAVVGLIGAGKTETVEYILKKTKYPRVYFGDVTFSEMQKQGLEINEANERKTREGIRAKFGMEAYATLSLPQIKNYFETSSVVIESLYSWEEYLEMKNEFRDVFKVLAVYASPETRMKRTYSRIHRPFTSEEFVSRDYSQVENLHQAGPIARADFMIINEGTKEDLYKQIDKVLEKLF